ncbi:hypothetical protein COS78_03275 [Candidatus Shapirobacteria bacterium CG06_land_8_20_14_3_00_40_12]|uniref:Uncharacterized protein n=2 Tax=Candidatus Shapironibacteriota TaxID=1752721 RepID=A0A2M7TT93_9BACT|nr:MAG: hypothetical protein COS78_03275 [Candidatus Shapirobacteria bacterium CG06_land_8_20_14_3_00_40_12]PIZ59264.1 MAG: hypothetical protein COY20_02105 [Candidatus Shapirobacteria bacterium CG_4_10_14_0_2_um_filter_40_12]
MKNRYYVIFSVIFLFLSFVGSIYLVRSNQNNLQPTSASVKFSAPTKTITPIIEITDTSPFSAVSLSEDGEPSPTRILLPLAGFEFPSLTLTLLGGIVTILGFLILL